MSKTISADTVDPEENIFEFLHRVQCLTMFPAGGHLGLRVDMSDTIVKWDHPTNIVTKFGSNWHSSFRGEDL